MQVRCRSGAATSRFKRLFSILKLQTPPPSPLLFPSASDRWFPSKARLPVAFPLDGRGAAAPRFNSLFSTVNYQLTSLFVSLSKAVSLSKFSTVNYQLTSLFVSLSKAVSLSKFSTVNYQLTSLFVSLSKAVSLSKISIVIFLLLQQKISQTFGNYIYYLYICCR